jgi:hypothetical protein
MDCLSEASVNYMTYIKFVQVIVSNSSLTFIASNQISLACFITSIIILPA